MCKTLRKSTFIALLSVATLIACDDSDAEYEDDDYAWSCCQRMNFGAAGCKEQSSHKWIVETAPEAAADSQYRQHDTKYDNCNSTGRKY